MVVVIDGKVTINGKFMQQAQFMKSVENLFMKNSNPQT